MESIAAIKAIQTGEVHPSINIEDPIPEISDIDVVRNVKQKHSVNVALNNSFGFGGDNAVVAFKKFEG